MLKQKRHKRISLNTETIRTLTNLDEVHGGGMCSTGAFTGLCPTQSITCTKPP